MTAETVAPTTAADVQIGLIRTELDGLQPARFSARASDLLRGGLPGGQGDGRRSANRGDPGFDDTDLWIFDQRAEHRRLLDIALEALRAVRIVETSMLAVVAAVDGVAVDEAKEKLWCTSCARVAHNCEPRLAGEFLEKFARKTSKQVAEVVAAKGLCWWCAEFWHVHQQLPPEGLVAYRATHGRVTARVLREFLKAPPPSRKKKRKSRK